MAEPSMEQRRLYNVVYAANKPWMKAIYNQDGFDPRIALQQINAAVAANPQGGQINWEQHVSDWHNNQPHPDTAHLPPSQQLKVGDYTTAVKMATQTKFGGHATAEEASAFWQEFQGANQTLAAQNKPTLTPQDYLTQVQQLAPVSAALHGRPPTMNEVVRLRDSSPKEARTSSRTCRTSSTRP